MSECDLEMDITFKKNIKLQRIYIYIFYIILYCVVATSACSFSVVKTTDQ